MNEYKETKNKIDDSTLLMFIAMVLVAAIGAAILIHTSGVMK